jgi:hypothetical protein
LSSFVFRACLSDDAKSVDGFAEYPTASIALTIWPIETWDGSYSTSAVAVLKLTFALAVPGSLHRAPSTFAAQLVHIMPDTTMRAFTVAFSVLVFLFLNGKNQIQMKARKSIDAAGRNMFMKSPDSKYFGLD